MTDTPKRRETRLFTYRSGGTEPIVVPPGWLVLMPDGVRLTQRYPAEPDKAGARTPPPVYEIPKDADPRSTESRSTETQPAKTVTPFAGTLSELGDAAKYWGGVGSPPWPGSRDDRNRPPENVSPGPIATPRGGLSSLAGLESLENRVFREVQALVDERVAAAREQAEKAVVLAGQLQEKARLEYESSRKCVAVVEKSLASVQAERDEAWTALAELKKSHVDAWSRLERISMRWHRFYEWALERGSADDQKKFMEAVHELQEAITS